MASSLSSTASLLIPAELNAFFESIYGAKPEGVQQKKNLLYSIPGKGISIITDPYGGCHINVKDISHLSADQMSIVREAIGKLTESFKVNKSFDSIWIDVALPAPVMTMGLIAPASFVMGKQGVGDLIYDYQQKKMKVWQWLNPKKECSIPPGATHNIGATALIIDRVAKKVLLVIDKRREDTWNLPGGSFDPVKDNAPSFTALREAQEEGGFELPKDVTFQPIHVGQMQFPMNQFAPAINQIWAYFIDGISRQRLNPPADEIKTAEWIDFSEILNAADKLRGLTMSDEIKYPLIAAINGRGFQEIVNKNWMIVHAPKE